MSDTLDNVYRVTAYAHAVPVDLRTNRTYMITAPDRPRAAVLAAIEARRDGWLYDTFDVLVDVRPGGTAVERFTPKTIALYAADMGIALPDEVDPVPVEAPSDYLSTLDAGRVAAAIEAFWRSDSAHAEELRSYARGDKRFAYWMYLVDRRLSRACGLTSADLEDHLWRDAYDTGMSPRDALADALDANGMSDLMGDDL